MSTCDMKVVSSKQMSAIEKKAYSHGCSEMDFMEKAGKGVAQVVHRYIQAHNLEQQVVLLCGKGNNAGDAYVAGVYLLKKGYRVFAFHASPTEACSPLCQENFHRFRAEGGDSLEIRSADELIFPDSGILLDGLFGTGFHGSPREPYASIIKAANVSQHPIIAVDIPSGLNGETGDVEGEVISATETAFLSLPKKGFFLKNGWNHVGILRFVDFGLPKKDIEETETDLIMVTRNKLKSLLPMVTRNRHKYQAGHVVGLSGSPTMPGAANLCSLSCLRGGAGLVRLLHPKGMEAELAGSPYELIKIPYTYEEKDKILDELNQATANYIGPGLGRHQEVRKLLAFLFPKLEKPIVIDADALTIISEDNLPLPKNCILTPHLGEMRRLLHSEEKTAVDIAFLDTCQDFVEKNHCSLILKGGPSFIFHPQIPVHVNPFGSPGMATAGSGDVLTGLLAALLAQGLSTHHAALLGVGIHSIAGEHAAQYKSVYGMIASDIIDNFGVVFRSMI